jgi:hypothetical protein
MNSRIREFFRRLFSLRNVVPLLTIIGAFIGTFVVTPFGLQREQLLLGLVAFLAIDALVERLELLTNIEKDVRAIKDLVTSSSSGKDFLRHQKDFPRLEHLITDAKRELWISGVTLDTMITLTGLFNSKLKEGFKLRFLAVRPEDIIVEETSNYLGVDSNELRGRLRANLDTLYKRLAPTDVRQVEIRTVAHRPSVGYFIVDPHFEQGYMTVITYLYHIQGIDVPPMLLISKKEDPYWFEIYLKDFERIWEDATRWEL